MTNNKRNCCVVCYYDGSENEEKVRLSTQIIYNKLGGDVEIKLCLSHDIEFFTLGQRRFLHRYVRLSWSPHKDIHPDFIQAILESEKKRLIWISHE